MLTKARTALDEMSKDGEFKRKDAAWRNWISTEEGAEFPPDKDRYHLFVAAACPWAHRTMMVRHLKGLEDAISFTVVHPTWQNTNPDVKEDAHCGWVFGTTDNEMWTNTAGDGGPLPAQLKGCDPNPLFESRTLRQIYERANDTEGKYSVPILWDKIKETIVSNESADIIQMFNDCFNQDGLCKNPELDLSPKGRRDAMKVVDDWIYPTINNGVYRCGFATSQQAYDKAIVELTASFDKLEEILKNQRYLTGDQITLSDIRLFSTLLRFDEVYVVYFKTNTRSVRHCPTLLNYCRDMYLQVKPTINMDQIKMHYYTSHPNLNKHSIIPKGADFIKSLDEPHNRDALSSNNKQETEA